MKHTCLYCRSRYTEESCPNCGAACDKPVLEQAAASAPALSAPDEPAPRYKPRSPIPMMLLGGAMAFGIGRMTISLMSEALPETPVSSDPMTIATSQIHNAIASPWTASAAILVVVIAGLWFAFDEPKREE